MWTLLNYKKWVNIFFSFFWVIIIKSISNNKKSFKFFYHLFCFHFEAIIISGVAGTPKIQVHTTTYDDTFKISENRTIPYNTIDVNPILGHVVFLIVGANDFSQITKSIFFPRCQWNHFKLIHIRQCLFQMKLYKVNIIALRIKSNTIMERI